MRGLKAAGRVWAGWGLSQEFYRDELYKQLGFDTVDDFLVDFWEAFWVSGLDANNLLSQLDTWQAADIAATPGYDGDLARALGDIRAKAFVCPGEKDLYFPPEDMALGGGADAERRVAGDPRSVGPPVGRRTRSRLHGRDAPQRTRPARLVKTSALEVEP